jgi:hypothetical protein
LAEVCKVEFAHSMAEDVLGWYWQTLLCLLPDAPVSSLASLSAGSAWSGLWRVRACAAEGKVSVVLSLTGTVRVAQIFLRRSDFLEMYLCVTSFSCNWRVFAFPMVNDDHARILPWTASVACLTMLGKTWKRVAW